MSLLVTRWQGPVLLSVITYRPHAAEWRMCWTVPHPALRAERARLLRVLG